jgi:CRP-like cAMP-binding protein
MIDPVALYDELALGRRKLRSIFCASTTQTLKANEKFAGAARPAGAVYRLRAGWACQFRELSNGGRAIVDVYIPGDIIGLDTVLHTRPLQEVLTLCAVTIDEVPREDALMQLMADRPTALYVAWLLGQRQRRADRLLAAISRLDARGRLAMMVLDFYARLRRRRVITGSMYNLPLTQLQISEFPTGDFGSNRQAVSVETDRPFRSKAAPRCEWVLVPALANRRCVMHPILLWSAKASTLVIIYSF